MARELALDLRDASFRPDVVNHTLSVASAGVLSRKNLPDVKFSSFCGMCSQSRVHGEWSKIGRKFIQSLTRI